MDQGDSIRKDFPSDDDDDDGQQKMPALPDAEFRREQKARTYTSCKATVGDNPPGHDSKKSASFENESQLQEPSGQRKKSPPVAALPHKTRKLHPSEPAEKEKAFPGRSLPSLKDANTSSLSSTDLSTKKKKKKRTATLTSGKKKTSSVAVALIPQPGLKDPSRRHVNVRRIKKKYIRLKADIAAHKMAQTESNESLVRKRGPRIEDPEDSPDEETPEERRLRKNRILDRRKRAKRAQRLDNLTDEFHDLLGANGKLISTNQTLKERIAALQRGDLSLERKLLQNKVSSVQEEATDSNQENQNHQTTLLANNTGPCAEAERLEQEAAAGRAKALSLPPVEVQNNEAAASRPMGIAGVSLSLNAMGRQNLPTLPDGDQSNNDAELIEAHLRGLLQGTFSQANPAAPQQQQDHSATLTSQGLPQTTAQAGVAGRGDDAHHSHVRPSRRSDASSVYLHQAVIDALVSQGPLVNSHSQSPNQHSGRSEVVGLQLFQALQQLSQQRRQPSQQQQSLDSQLLKNLAALLGGNGNLTATASLFQNPSTRAFQSQQPSVSFESQDQALLLHLIERERRQNSLGSAQPIRHDREQEREQGNTRDQNLTSTNPTAGAGSSAEIESPAFQFISRLPLDLVRRWLSMPESYFIRRSLIHELGLGHLLRYDQESDSSSHSHATALAQAVAKLGALASTATRPAFAGESNATVNGVSNDELLRRLTAVLGEGGMLAEEPQTILDIPASRSLRNRLLPQGNNNRQETGVPSAALPQLQQEQDRTFQPAHQQHYHQQQQPLSRSTSNGTSAETFMRHLVNLFTPTAERPLPEVIDFILHGGESASYLLSIFMRSGHSLHPDVRQFLNEADDVLSRHPPHDNSQTTQQASVSSELPSRLLPGSAGRNGLGEDFASATGSQPSDVEVALLLELLSRALSQQGRQQHHHHPQQQKH